MSNLSRREQDLQGKVAVVTGASRGIGRAIARNLALRGCSILGTCSDKDSLWQFDALNDDIRTAQNGRAVERDRQLDKVFGICADIYSPTCAQEIADALQEFFHGRVEIFVNNAADPRAGVIGQLTVEEIQESLIGNIQTPVLIVEELVKRKYFQPESRIIYISSIRSRQPWSMQLMYSAGKSAGESLCRTWAEAFGGKEERVNFHPSPFYGVLATDNLLVLFHEWNHCKCSHGRIDPDRFGHAMSTRCA